MVLGGPLGTIVLVAVSLLFPVAMIARASRPGAPGPLVLLVLAVLLVGAGSGVLVFSGSSTLHLGLPSATWWMVIGLWLIPLSWTCWAFASGFRHFLPDAETMERLRRVRRGDR